MSPYSCVKSYYVRLRHDIEHIQWSQVHDIQYNISLHYFISNYHVTLADTLHYITLRYICYVHILFYTCCIIQYMICMYISWMSNRWHTHTPRRHFTGKSQRPIVGRGSLVDLWRTALEKCVARIRLRPACHCCPNGPFQRTIGTKLVTRFFNVK